MGFSVPLPPLGTAGGREGGSPAEDLAACGRKLLLYSNKKGRYFSLEKTPVWPWVFKATKYTHMPLAKTELRPCLNADTDAKCPATHSYVFWSSSWVSFSQSQFFRK